LAIRMERFLHHVLRNATYERSRVSGDEHQVQL
jgi:hypothetical protein